MRVRPDTKKKLNKFSATFGMPHVEMAGRLITWFMDQDQTLQMVILGLVEEKDRAKILDMIKNRPPNKK